METKFTKGEWSVIKAKHGTSEDDRIVATIENGSEDRVLLICSDDLGGNNYANSELIAAAYDGYKAAEYAYLVMLNIRDYSIRLEEGFQSSLCLLRNFIAKAANRSAEDVQNEFEAKARGEQP